MIIINEIEKHLFLEGIFMRYGYDFREYTQGSLNRRLENLLQKNNTTSLLDVLKKCLESSDFFKKSLASLTINTTEFFRDPTFFKELRESVIQHLKTYPKISIWIAGCSTGEEIISLVILLHEEGVLQRSTLYATDINPEVLMKAKEGVYKLSCIQQFNLNYALAGGTKSPSDYYTCDNGLITFDRTLLNNVVYSEHNLVTDSVFMEAHLILCRNVLIYFSRDLQNKVLKLFANSLVFRGFLGLGSKEDVQFTKAALYFNSINSSQKIFSIKSRVVDKLKISI